MKKNKLIVTLCLLVFFVGVLSSNTRVVAAEDSATGGQVSTTSKITFTGEIKKPDPKPQPQPNPKPKPPLPQTGESKSGLSLLGLGLLGMAMILIKGRQGEKE